MRAKKVYEAITDILTPKTDKEIEQKFLDKFGFMPSEESLIIKQEDDKYPIEYHGRVIQPGHSFVEFFKFDPKNGPYSMTPLKDAEDNWMRHLLNGFIPLDNFILGKNFDKFAEHAEDKEL